MHLTWSAGIHTSQSLLMRVSSGRVRKREREKSGDGCEVAVPVSTKAPFVSLYHIRDVIRTTVAPGMSAKWR